MMLRRFAAVVSLAALLAGCGAKSTVGEAQPAESTASSSSSTTAAATESAPADTWVVVDGDGFDARMPGTPERQLQNQDSAVGTVPLELFTYDRGSDALLVSGIRFPPNTTYDLDAGVAGAAKNTGTSIAESVTDELDGAEARRFRLSGLSDGVEVTMFGVVAEKNSVVVLVQYVVQGTTTTAPADFEKLIDSVTFDA